jgi:hypothetical protein
MCQSLGQLQKNSEDKSNLGNIELNCRSFPREHQMLESMGFASEL